MSKKIVVLMGDFPEEVWDQFKDSCDDLVNDNTAGKNAKIYARGDASLAALMAHILYTQECVYGRDDEPHS